MTPRKIRSLQQILKLNGFDPGPVDGIVGPKTLAAIDAILSALSDFRALFNDREAA